MRSRFSLGDKATLGVVAGGVFGFATGATASIWGGYEVGTMINDKLEFTNDLGRAAIDIVMMSVLASPVLPITTWGGVSLGAASGAILHPVTNGIRSAGSYVSGLFNRNTSDTTDEKKSLYIPTSFGNSSRTNDDNDSKSRFLDLNK